MINCIRKQNTVLSLINVNNYRFKAAIVIIFKN